MISVEYPGVLNLFAEKRDAKRTDSAAFLIWFFENYYRLDETEAIDSVCDQRGDKGVDGVYVNEIEGTIDFFQCKLAQSADSSIGDTVLKEFFGTLSQFDTQQKISELINNNPNLQLTKILIKNDILKNFETHKIRGVFVSNLNIDSNGQNFLNGVESIRFLGKDYLEKNFISSDRTISISKRIEFDITGFIPSVYQIDQKIQCAIVPVRSIDLIKLEGIQDHSIFSFNVRGSLGNTKVNRDIVKSIRTPDTHKYFPLFHNGMTIICKDLTINKNSIEISGYHVVNGCQSLTSVFENQSFLSEDLRIMAKLIKMDVDSDLSQTVTRYSNNQNGVKARDFQSNSGIQIRLKNEIESKYPNQYWYEIKRGDIEKPGTRITNEEAGLNLMAFDLKQPWATHRKYQVFDEKHTDLFARPEVDAARIIMVQVLKDTVIENLPTINNGLFAKYALTKYLIIYFIRQVLEIDPLGKSIIRSPIEFVQDVSTRSKFKKLIERILSDLIVDINAEVNGLAEDFDYRGKVREEIWVKNLEKSVISSYQKLVQRNRIQAISQEWEDLK